jgi:hypothetical protein
MKNIIDLRLTLTKNIRLEVNFNEEHYRLEVNFNEEHYRLEINFNEEHYRLEVNFNEEHYRLEIFLNIQNFIWIVDFFPISQYPIDYYHSFKSLLKHIG